MEVEDAAMSVFDHEELSEPTSVEEFLNNPRNFKITDDFRNTMVEIDDTLLTHAVRSLKVDAVKYLLETHSDSKTFANQPNRKGVTPISAAATKGSVEIIEPLIEAGANVDACNQSGSTALIQASHFGHYDAVELLLERKANADFANTKGTTALMRASQEGHVEICKLLIKSGADVNRKNHEGMNALMLASQRGHADMARLLTEKDAVVDEQTGQGSTALMLACKRGHEKVVEVLVSMGAEIFIRDRRSRTARDTALRRNHNHLVNLLDTTVQRNRIQDLRFEERSLLFKTMEKAFIEGRLLLSPSYLHAANLYDKHIRRGDTNYEDSGDIEAVAYLNESIQKSYTDIPDRLGNKRTIRKGYADWQWPYLFYRCLALPNGLFGMIKEFIPKPRIWQWQLTGIRRRCKLAPHQAILDLFSIIDDIMNDANVFSDEDQSLSLVKLVHNQPLQEYMVHNMNMTKQLVEALVKHHDVQSLATRCSDAEVSFKYAMSKKLLVATIHLFKWQLSRQDPDRAMGLGLSDQNIDNSLSRAHTCSTMGDTEDGGDEGGTPLNDQDTETEIENVPDDEDVLEVLDNEHMGSENEFEEDDGSDDDHLMDLN